MGGRVGQRTLEEGRLVRSFLSVCFSKYSWANVEFDPVSLLRNDPKSVAIVALACNHPNTKVQSAAIHFFLGSENEDEDSDDEVDEVSAFLPPFFFFFSKPNGLFSFTGTGSSKTSTPSDYQQKDQVERQSSPKCRQDQGSEEKRECGERGGHPQLPRSSAVERPSEFR